MGYNFSTKNRYIILKFLSIYKIYVLNFINLTLNVSWIYKWSIVSVGKILFYPFNNRCFNYNIILRITFVCFQFVTINDWCGILWIVQFLVNSIWYMSNEHGKLRLLSNYRNFPPIVILIFYQKIQLHARTFNLAF